MTLLQWIDRNGGATPTSRILGVTRNNVHAWISRASLPRPETMKVIVKMSRQAVTYSDMIEDYLDNKYSKKKKSGGHRSTTAPKRQTVRA